MPSSTPVLKFVALWIALGLATGLAYSNSFSADFVTDSAVLIKQDPRIRAATAENIQNIFHQPYWWPSFESNLYRPVTTLSYLVNYAVFDDRDAPAGYHVINVLLHWTNAWLVLVTVRRLTGRLAVAGIAGALFALHPANTEAVTNIAGRADLLAALAVLTGGWCYMRASSTTGSGRVVWLIGLGASTFAGVFAKESGVMIVAFLLLYNVLWRYRDRDVRMRDRIRQDVAGYIAIAPALIALWLARRDLPAVSPVFADVFVDNPTLGATNWLQAKMTAIGVLGRYLARLVYPVPLSSDYSYNQIPLFTSTDVLAWISLTVVVALMAAAVFLRKRLPLFAWGVGFFFLMLLPTSNLVLPIGSIMAERFVYLPSAGFCAVAAMALWWGGAALAHLAGVKEGMAGRLTVAIAALVLVAFGARTYARNADWRDERALWASARAASPNSFKVYKGSAAALWNNGIGAGEKELDEAIALAERGRAILDSPPLPVSQQDNTLLLDLGQYYRRKGEFLIARGQRDDGHRYFQKSIAALLQAREVDRAVNQAARQVSLDRGIAADKIADAGNHHIYIQLGATYLNLNDWADAEAAGRYAMRLQPADVDGYRMTAIARLNQNQPRDAAVLYVVVVTLQPDNAGAWNELGFCLQRLGLQPVPVLQSGNRFMLDDGSPDARKLRQEAAATLVRQLEESKQPEAAQAYRRRLIDWH